jgi:hypothetical protein
MNVILTLLPRLYDVVFLIIWLGGLVYAIINRQKHPWTSLLAGLALGILFLTGLIWSVMSIYTQHQISTGELPIDKYMNIQNLLDLGITPFMVLGRLLILAAIFWRKDDGQNQVITNHAG